ncbi:camp-dependent protein kinase catalytic subunit, partial [Cladochytrium tenue]
MEEEEEVEEVAVATADLRPAVKDAVAESVHVHSTAEAEPSLRSQQSVPHQHQESLPIDPPAVKTAVAVSVAAVAPVRPAAALPTPPMAPGVQVAVTANTTKTSVAVSHSAVVTPAHTPTPAAPAQLPNPRPLPPPPPPPKSAVATAVSFVSVQAAAAKDMPPPPPPKAKIALADLQIKRTLGTGSFGRVHLALLGERPVALKVLRKADVVKLKQVEHTLDEKRILAAVSSATAAETARTGGSGKGGRCPFLVDLLGTFADSTNLYLVQEFVAGGELFSLLRRRERFEDSVARFYAAEVVAAFKYLHDRDIIYRDLKPENLLIDARGHIKITDFGFAKQITTETWTLCGTPDYLAPEIIQSRGYGKAVDWWALGILIYEMLAGHPPFFDDDPFRLYEKILACRLAFPPHMTAPARDLVRRLLTPDLTRRFGTLRRGARDVLDHPWFEAIDWDGLHFVPAPYVPPVRSPADDSMFDVYDEDFEPYGRPGPDPYKD